MEKLESLLHDFKTHLHTALEQGWMADAPIEQLRKKAEALDQLCDDIMALGDEAQQEIQALNTVPNGQHYPYLYLHFNWMEQAKSFLLLWRDVIFEQQKADLFLKDQQVDADRVEQLQKQSLQLLMDVSSALWEARPGNGSVRPSTSKLQLEDWRIQQNPWPIYRQQIAKLPQQADALLAQYQLLDRYGNSLRNIRTLIAQLLQEVNSRVDDYRKQSSDTIAFVEQQTKEVGKINTHIDKIEQHKATRISQKQFTQHMEKELALFEDKNRVSIAILDGILQYKEVFFQRNIQQWLDSEIMPLLYELWELSDQIDNSLKMSLLNIRNRNLLLSNERKEGVDTSVEEADLSQPLHMYLDKLEGWSSSVQQLGQWLDERMEEQFYITVVYDPLRPFLPLPLQSSINKLRQNQNQFFARIQSWTRRQVNLFQRFKRNVEREEALSDSEKIVRFIQTKSADPKNAQYTSIFQTRGYIGESFWVGRKIELRRVKSLVDQWQEGFRGAILLSGQRFCGKSLFGDVVGDRYFSGNTIRLLPNSSIQLGGRTLNTTYKLEEALEFIEKYSLQSRPLIWIDDLELWRDVNIPLSKNIRALQKHIDRFSGKLFYLVSMSNWLKAHLAKTHQLDNTFQAEINLDRMGINDIQQGILIRHGATHKQLVDKEGKELSSQAFRELIRKVYRSSNGNIGEALDRWAYSIRRLDEDRVIYKPLPNRQLPDFISPETGLLLTTVMMERRINEYRLRKRFGQPFKEKYNAPLQRLSNVGLLTRKMDGWLEVRENIANDVGKLLDQNNYLRFYQ
ncbi:MAG: hypothetical protein AAFP19_12400 [Bacteroidota bacterium]